MKLAQWAKEYSVSSDVAVAQALMKEVWPERAGRPVKTCLADIFEAVKRVERALPKDVLRDRRRQWTARRVKAIWKKEARRIDNFEMVDLETAALEAAAHEYRESIERSQRMARFLSARSASGVREMA